MNKTLIYALAMAITIGLFAAVEFAGTSGTAQPQGPAAQRYPAVSFEATPVQYAQVNGIKLGYREFGSGEPLLMIQGFGAAIGDWNETFIGILATRYHVFTYDHRAWDTAATAIPRLPCTCKRMMQPR